MFIWDWVSIAFGWLVFLFLMLIIIAFVKKVIEKIQNNLTVWNPVRFLYCPNCADDIKSCTVPSPDVKRDYRVAT
ncbi:Uncharacterised protein [Streptococcus pneumoniae]|nr:Uncharacterised protein [Streptococcus pneumoniae]